MELVLDIETTYQIKDGRTDPSPYNPLNRLVSVGYKSTCGVEGYLFFDHKDGGTPDAFRTLQSILDNTRVLVAHNAKFDLSWLLEIGLSYSGVVYDTMVFEYILAKGLKPSLSLHDCCVKYGLTPKLDIFKKYKEQGINTDAIPQDELKEYGMGDIQATFELYQLQQELIKTSSEVQSMLPAINLSMEVTSVLIDMERNGIYINKDALKEVELEYRKESARLEDIMQKMVVEVMGHRPINLNSSEHLSWIIYSRKVKDKKIWADIFNIGTEERGSVVKKKYQPKFPASTFKHHVVQNMETLYRQDAEHCLTCNGTGKVQKVKVNGEPFKKLNACTDCGGAGFTYHNRPEIAGFKVKPINSTYATASGFASDRQTINDLIASGKVSQKAKEFLECLSKYNAIQTYLSTFVEGIQKNIREDTFLHTSLNQCITATGRLSSSNPNCFSDDTEVLTDSGWRLFKDVLQEDKVAQYDFETKEINFALPVAYVQYPYYGYMQHLKKARFQRQGSIDMLVTPDHDCWLVNRKTKIPYKVPAAKYSKDAMQVQAGWYKGGHDTWSESKVALYCAFQADGHIRKADGIAEFTFSKQRKIDRLEWALGREGVPYRKSSIFLGRTRISISRKDIPSYFSKLLSYETIFSLSSASLSMFTKEVMLWDGCKDAQSQYCSISKHNAEVVQTAFILSGKTAKVRKYKDKYFIVDVCDKEGNHTSNMLNKDVLYAGNVYCVTMPKGTIVVRRNGVVAITGNCQNMPRNKTFPVRKCFASRFAGGYILEADFAQLEFRVAAMLSGCDVALNDILAGVDVHAFTAKVLTDAGQETDRQTAKSSTFKPLYGGASGTDAEMTYYKSFLNKYSGIKRWHERLVTEACGGKKQIQIPSGRIYAFPNARRISSDRVLGKTQIVNYPVQGFATADVAWVVILDVFKEIKQRKLKSRLILQVHDSVVADVHPEEKEVMINIFKNSFTKANDLMEEWFNFKTPVPIGYDMAIGTNLMEKDKVE